MSTTNAMKRARFEAGWTRLEDALAQWTEETKAVWYVRKRVTTERALRVVVRCSHHERPVGAKCRAKTAFVCTKGTNHWLLDHKHTVWEHNGHTNGKRAAVETPAAPLSGGTSSEALRRLHRGVYPGLSNDTRLDDPLYDVHLWTLSRSRRRAFRRVTCIESTALFEQALREEDRAYFAWWELMVRDPMAPLVFLRVEDASAVDVQRSLIREQVTYGVLTKGLANTSPSHTRHAVFSSPDRDNVTLLAINVYALRCYRLMTLQRLDGPAAMPMAPVLLQAWGLRPMTDLEYSARRFGMLTTMLFLQRSLGRSYAKAERHLFGINEPGFEIYDNLPGFISHFAPTETELRVYLYTALNAATPSSFDFCSVLAAFLFQKHKHLLGSDIVGQLFLLFNEGRWSRRLKERHPQAWRVIRSMHGKMNGTQNCYVKLTKAEKTQEPLPLPPAYYLYRVAFDPDNSVIETRYRFDICVGMTLCEKFVVEPILARATHYDNKPYLANYTYALAQPSKDALSKQLQPFTKNQALQAMLGPLFSVLRAVDYHRHKGQSDRVPNELLDENPPPELVDGPLTVRDPLDFALYYANLPFARYALHEPRVEGLPDLAYFDESLFVWTTKNEARSKLVAEEEAYLLVRDPAFYVK